MGEAPREAGRSEEEHGEHGEKRAESGGKGETKTGDKREVGEKGATGPTRGRRDGVDMDAWPKSRSETSGF